MWVDDGAKNGENNAIIRSDFTWRLSKSQHIAKTSEIAQNLGCWDALNAKIYHKQTTYNPNNQNNTKSGVGYV